MSLRRQRRFWKSDKEKKKRNRGAQVYSLGEKDYP
jgi:hypothetical protein